MPDMKDKNLDKNPDFKSVSWNNNFCIVKYKDKETNLLVSITLSNYFDKFKDLPKEERPKITKMTIKTIKENVLRLLSHYDYKIKYNIIKNIYEIFINNKKSSMSLEHHISDILDMGDKHNFITNKERLSGIIRRIGQDKKFNPIENYLKKSREYYLKNKNKDIFNELLDTLKTDCIYKEKFVKKYLLQMVVLACSKDNSQTAGQHMLILQGKQGIGKTTWFKNLLPIEFRKDYFLAGRTFDPANKDDIIETVSCWLVELGEISSTFRKADMENLKNFITNHVDKVRIPYDKEATLIKRRTSFCGTTNDIEYLKDLTGNRRFLTIQCQDIALENQSKIDLNMLWGYFYDMYLKNEEKYYFSDKEVEQITVYNDQFINKPELLIQLEEKFIINPEIDEGDDWHNSNEIIQIFNGKLEITSTAKLTKEIKRLNVRHKRDKNKGNVFNLRLKGGND